MPRKDWPSKVGRGSPRGSLKFGRKKKKMVATRSEGMWSGEGGKEVKRKKKHQRWLVTAGTGVERKILAADSCRDSAARAMQAS
jgi:hypothetical protein